MLIIILIALLSIAYFEPPGGSGGILRIEGKQGEMREIKPLISKTGFTPAISTKPFLEGKFYYEREIGKLKLEILKKEKTIKELEKKILEIKPQRLEEKEAVGRHEFTDLRSKN